MNQTPPAPHPFHSALSRVFGLLEEGPEVQTQAESLIRLEVQRCRGMVIMLSEVNIGFGVVIVMSRCMAVVKVPESYHYRVRT